MDIAISALIVSVISAIISGVLVFISFLTLREMKNSREQNLRPYIIMGYELDSDRVLHLFIQNIGATAARNIKVDMSNPIKITEEYNAKEMLFSEPIKYLAPSQKIDTVLFPIWQVHEESQPDCYNKIKIEYYRSNCKKAYAEYFEINAKPYINTLYMDNKTIEDVVKQLEEMNKILTNLK